MRSTIIRWTLYCFALFAAGPAAGFLISMIRAADGGPGSALVNTSPIIGLAITFAALLIAAAVGAVTGRLLGAAPALTAAGIVIAWAAWKSAEVEQLIRIAQGGGPLVRLALEGSILGILGFGLVIGCLFATRNATNPWHLEPLSKLLGKNGMTTIVVGVVAGGVAAWLIAATPLKGQAVFAAIAAGTMAAAATRLVDIDTPIHVMFIPIAILAILGPLTGLIFSGNVVAATYKGALFPLANIAPLDWIAGGLLGVPMGVSWAGSMIEKRIQDGPSPVPAR